MKHADKQKLLKKLKKILALAKFGVGGEKTNAQRLLKKLSDQHKITINELEKQTEIQKPYKYLRKYEKEILFQIVFKITKSKDLSYRQVHPTKVSFLMSQEKHEIVEKLYSKHKKLFKKEMKRLVAAFIQKHDLFSGCGSNTSTEDVDWDEIRKILQMSRGLEDAPIDKDKHIEHKK